MQPCCQYQRDIAIIDAAQHILQGMLTCRYCQYCRQDLFNSMLPKYHNIFQHDKNLRILIFSGDVDGIVPVMGTRSWLASLQLPVLQVCRPWDSLTGASFRLTDLSLWLLVTKVLSVLSCLLALTYYAQCIQQTRAIACSQKCCCAALCCMLVSPGVITLRSCH